MAIQFRRGQHNKFDKTKMLAGEPAVVLGGDPDTADGKALYIAFAQGDATRMARADEIPGEASQSAAGLMSAGDKAKLDSVAVGANAYVHPSYTARTGKPTGNQTHAFGATFPVSQIVTDAQGHVTAATDRTVRIPDTEASQGAHGLMSAADKKALDAIKVTSGNKLHRLVTAPVVTASDAYAAPPVALCVQGRSVQDGTPAPDAPVSIQSVESVGLVAAGVNLLPSLTSDITKNGITFHRNPKGSITTNGTATALAAPSLLEGGTLPAGTYTLSGCPSGGSFNTYRLDLYIADRTAAFIDYGSGVTFTLWNPAVVKYCRIRIPSGVTVNDVIFHPTLTRSSSVQPYTPYVGSTTAIPLQGHALRSLPDGTHDELRVDSDGSVTLVQRVSTITLDGSNYAPWVSGGGPYTRFGMTVPNVASCAPLCDIMYRADNLGALTTSDSKVFVADNRIYFSAYSTVTTAEQAAAFLAAHPMTVHYKLPTPVEIPLGTVSLPSMPAPDLTAWASCTPATDIELDYERDVTIALAAAESVAANSLAPADGPTATASHAAGSLLTLGGQLVKATRAIVAGEQIAIGTNVAVTTVAAELAALA